MLNLSTTGCLIRSGIALEEGMAVRIGLQGLGSFEAEVIRFDGLEAGCQFLQPLRQEQIDLAFTKNVVLSGNWDVISASTEVLTSDTTLSSRAKLASVVVLSIAFWAMITAAAYSFF